MAHWGLSHQKQTNKLINSVYLVSAIYRVEPVPVAARYEA